MNHECIQLFTKFLAICYAENLIGKNMFAIGGCKTSSNCSKEWSGTEKDMRSKVDRFTQWMETREGRIGSQEKTVKSNITDKQL